VTLNPCTGGYFHNTGEITISAWIESHNTGEITISAWIESHNTGEITISAWIPVL
jgi:hypothetical protein